MTDILTKTGNGTAIRDGQTVMPAKEIISDGSIYNKKVRPWDLVLKGLIIWQPL